MYEEFISALTVFVTQAMFAPFIMNLLEFREPSRSWRRLWACLIAAIVLVNIGFILLYDFSFYSRCGTFTLVAPYILATIVCSRYHGLRVVFSVMSAFYMAVLGSANGYVAGALFPSMLLPLIVRVVSFGLLFLLFRRLGHAYRRMLRVLDRGWLVLSLIPLSTCLLVLYIHQRCFKADPLGSWVLVYGPLFICGCAFYLMYLFFDRVRQEDETRAGQNMLQVQVDALRRRTEAVNSAAEAVRLEKHDLRHRLAAIAELISRGDRQEALGFLEAAQTKLDENQAIRWCRQPVLDAVFASCFSRAKGEGIDVQTRLEIAEQLPVDEAELAIVLSNALDNAINACKALPQERRTISCKVISYPNLMLELRNPCAREVVFDSDGLPLSDSPGHGLGVRSIAAFCQKYGALCQYEQQDGNFSLRILL